jgi:predicted transposase YbfD/YdcC
VLPAPNTPPIIASRSIARRKCGSSCRRAKAQRVLCAPCSHWQIENALHWQLDVSFGEDAQRNRKDNGPAKSPCSAAALSTSPASIRAGDH